MDVLLVFLNQFIRLCVAERTRLFKVEQALMLLFLVALRYTEDGIGLGSLVIDDYGTVSIGNGIIVHAQAEFQ